MGAFDRERAAVLRHQFLPDATAADATHALRGRVRQRQTGADAVRGVPHRRQSRPIIGPAVHVLLVGRPEELQPPQFAVFVESLDVQKLPGVHHGLGHHVGQPGLLDEPHDPLAVGDVRGHRHGAEDVFAGLQRRDRHRPVVGDRRIDVHEVDPRVGQHVLEPRVPVRHAVEVGRLVAGRLAAPADGVQLGVRVGLVDRQKLRPEPQADHGHADRAVGNRGRHRSGPNEVKRSSPQADDFVVAPRRSRSVSVSAGPDRRNFRRAGRSASSAAGRAASAGRSDPRSSPFLPVPPPFLSRTAARRHRPRDGPPPPRPTVTGRTPRPTPPC